MERLLDISAPPKSARFRSNRPLRLMVLRRLSFPRDKSDNEK